MTNRVLVEGLRIGFAEAGAGPPLLLLHGGLSDGWEWHRQLDALADRWRVVAWDAPGCGGSDDCPSEWSMRDYAQCVAGFCRAVGLDRPHVAGLSFGAALALAVVEVAPDLPRSLALLSGYAGWAGSLPPEAVDARLHAVLAQTQRPVAPSTADGLAFTAPDAAAEVLEEVRVLAARSRSEALVTMAGALASADLRGVLPAVRVPTLVIAGLEDRRAGVPVAEAIAAGIPQARLVVVPGAGHVLHQEAPEAVEAALRAFLLEVEGHARAGRL